ncbi:MAG: DUF3127 domain-containing protein [Planctomycetota bacterium]|nr:DUF3127 domain-containing protein [Planctomycetota bacterium]MDA0921487.1 DUF3127 domain-containing protein [Planctomycetota bacterium]MDA1160110.1 DUF3127 domain-containing protein [Planctomycetota bacterium]
MSDGKVSGKVHFIDETKTFGQNGFRKRTVVLEQDSGRFTNYIPIEFIQDSCDTVDSLKVGDEAEITFELTGRKWQRDAASEVKYFLNAQASSFRVLGSGAAAPDSDDDGAPMFDPSNETEFDEDNVPF